MSIKEMKNILLENGFSIGEMKYIGKETFRDNKGIKYVVPEKCECIYIISSEYSMHTIKRR